MIQETEGFPVAEELTTLGLGGNPEPPRPSAGNRPHVEWPFLAPTFLIPNSEFRIHQSPTFSKILSKASSSPLVV